MVEMDEEGEAEKGKHRGVGHGETGRRKAPPLSS